MATVKRTAGPGAQILATALTQLEGVSGKVGWFESSKYDPSGTSVAYVAAIQEFGYPPKNIPPRMGLRQLVKEKRAAWAAVAAKGAKRIMAGDATATDMMELIGGVAEADVRKQIKSVWMPSLAESTVLARNRKLAKGDSLTQSGVKPLNDTGYMIATLTHVVHEAGEE